VRASSTRIRAIRQLCVWIGSLKRGSCRPMRFESTDSHSRADSAVPTANEQAAPVCLEAAVRDRRRHSLLRCYSFFHRSTMESCTRGIAECFSREGLLLRHFSPARDIYLRNDSQGTSTSGNSFRRRVNRDFVTSADWRQLNPSRNSVLKVGRSTTKWICLDAPVFPPTIERW
jgi:hypothetical protein